MTARVEFHVRIPASLVKKLDARTKKRARESGTSWSRNDEIVALLKSVLEEGDRRA